MTVRVPGKCHRSGVCPGVWPAACCPCSSASNSPGSIMLLQGGIDPCENPFVAAARELLEETGIRSIEFVAQVRQG